MHHMFVHLLVEVVLLKILHVCDSVLEDVLGLDRVENEVDVIYPEDVSVSKGEFLGEGFFWESVDKGKHESLELAQAMD